MLDLRVTPLVRDVVELAAEPIRWTELLARMTARHPGAVPARVEAVLDRLGPRACCSASCARKSRRRCRRRRRGRRSTGVPGPTRRPSGGRRAGAGPSRWDALPPAEAAAERAALDETTRASCWRLPPRYARTWRSTWTGRSASGWERHWHGPPTFRCAWGCGRPATWCSLPIARGSKTGTASGARPVLKRPRSERRARGLPESEDVRNEAPVLSGGATSRAARRGCVRGGGTARGRARRRLARGPGPGATGRAMAGA